MQVHVMPHVHMISDQARGVMIYVENRAILDIRGFSDVDSVHISPQHAPKPDARVLAESHTANDIRPWGDKGARMNRRICT
jgi:hypothetical protein